MKSFSIAYYAVDSILWHDTQAFVQGHKGQQPHIQEI
jgi:hypothetical protein